MAAKILLFLMFTIPVLAGKANAQNMSINISGIIVDSLKNQPLGYITLILKEDKTNSAQNALSDNDGIFKFSGLKPVAYVLTINEQGFKNKNLIINLIRNTKSTINLGVLRLLPDVNSLKEVIVKGNGPVAKQEIDRISYNVQADPESKRANVLDLMRKVPLLSVDGEQMIRLRGSTNYRIFINGQPSVIFDKNPQDILRTMPASGIEKFEIITVIPAKYQAEALDGIINIVTLKKVNDGYAGNINISYRVPAVGPGAGGTLNIKSGRLGLSAFTGASLTSTPPVTNSLERFTETTTLMQNTVVKAKGNNKYWGTDWSFELDSLKLISGQLNVSENHSFKSSYLHSLLNDSNNSTQSYRLNSNNVLNGNNIDASLNYQAGFKKDKSRLLTFSYRVFKTKNNRKGDFDVAEATRYALPDYKQSNHENSLEQSFQADYFHPFKKLILEAGLKGTFRSNKSQFEYGTLGNNQAYDINQGLSNRFNNTQIILGIYNSYQYRLNKQWNFKAGIRLEQSAINANFMSEQLQVKRSYFDYIPSLSIQKQLKNNASLLFGYSRKIKRPEIQHLNPFVDRSNPNNESSGNPDLQPASSNSLELSYSSFKKLSLYLRLNYDLNSRLVFPILTYDAANRVTQSVLSNSGYLRMGGVSVYASYPVVSRLTASTNLTTIYGRINGLINNALVSNQRVMYYFSASSSYRFDKGWRMSGSVNLNGADINLQGIENSAYRGCGFSITKELSKNQWYFTLEANNPFSKYRNNNSTTNGENFYQERNNQRYLSNFALSLNYHFGALKSNVKKTQKVTLNDDKGISLY